MTGTYPEYLLLQKGETPPADPHATGVRVYADADGALRSIQSDGTDAAIGGGGGSMSSVLSSHKVTLEAADILALGTTPFTLVPAVAGQIICPLALIGSVHYGIATYAEAGQPRVFLGSTWGTSGWGSPLSPSSAITASHTTVTYTTPSQSFANMLDDDGETLGSLVEQPFRIDETDAVTVGDSSIDFTTLYFLLTP